MEHNKHAKKHGPEMSSKIGYCLFICIAIVTHEANSQNLFGNPSCQDWKELKLSEKNLWLNAFLVPLNLTNVSRQKPREDKFSKLASIDVATSYVDSFCQKYIEEQASVGAIQFLDALTTDKNEMTKP
jgi:hypothetical protein